MAEVRLPSTLAPLFPGLPRKLDVQTATVSDVIDGLERHWPAIRDRLCEPGAPRSTRPQESSPKWRKRSRP
jgi:hypothetical protein